MSLDVPTDLTGSMARLKQCVAFAVRATPLGFASATAQGAVTTWKLPLSIL